MQRFYLADNKLSDNYIECHDVKLIRQIIKVERAKEGDRVIFFNNGREFLCQLINIDKNKLKFLIVDEYENDKNLDRQITLYQSLIKLEKFEWLLQKVTELGVQKIVPVVSERSVITDFSPAKRKRALEIIKEATEQCGGAIMPELSRAIKFNDAIKMSSETSAKKIIAWEEETKNKIIANINSDVDVFIGPEGGWSKNEIDLALKNNFEVVSLGKRILRAETAAIYVASILSL